MGEQPRRVRPGVFVWLCCVVVEVPWQHRGRGFAFVETASAKVVRRFWRPRSVLMYLPHILMFGQVMERFRAVIEFLQINRLLRVLVPGVPVDMGPGGNLEDELAYETTMVLVVMALLLSTTSWLMPSRVEHWFSMSTSFRKCRGYSFYHHRGW